MHDALAATPVRVPLTGYAEAPPLGHVNDRSTHFTAVGQRLLGAGYYESFRAVITAKTPAGTLP